MPEDPSEGAKREPTFGETAVGLSFNPSGDTVVRTMKEKYAQVIDQLDSIRGAERSERAALLTIAIRSAQEAQMWAVKAITWKD